MLTQYNGVLPETLTVAQLFTSSHRSCITKSSHAATSHYIYLRSILILSSRPFWHLQRSTFHSCVHTKIFYAKFITLVIFTCSTHLIFLVLIISNKSQQDAPFFNFILVRNSTCFGQTYCPSSGVLILYSQPLVFVILVMLTASEVRMELILTSLADSQHNYYDKYQWL